MHQLQSLGLLVIVIVAAWLLFRVIRKIIVALIVITLLAALALFVYIKFF